MNVTSLMSPNPVVVLASTSIDHALELLDQHDIRHLPVLEEGELVGIVSDRDILEAVGGLPSRVHACRGGDAVDGLARTVREVMQTKVIEVGPLASLHQVARLFHTHRIGSLPVVEDGRLIGIVTEVDLLKGFAARDFEDLRGLGSQPVASLMERRLVKASWFNTLDDALELCQDGGLRHVPVMEGEALVGLVSDRDLRRALGVGRLGETPLDEIMTHRPRTTGRMATVAEVAREMVDEGISCLPVVRGGPQSAELEGIVTTTDLVEACVRFVPEMPASA